MRTIIFESAEALGLQAGSDAVTLMQQAIRTRGEASIIVATGMTQFSVYDALIEARDIAWDRVTAFHLDEYIGLSGTHVASFGKYLKERFVDRLSGRLAAFHYIDGETDPAAECRRLRDRIAETSIDLCLAGIGDNGHLAFNDPPADFETNDPFIVVDLDEVSRTQQLSQGWFETLEAVPSRAISMSIRQIIKSKAIICSVSGQKKSQTVVNCFEGPVTPRHPASILQQHKGASLYLDKMAASRLSPEFLATHAECAGA